MFCSNYLSSVVNLPVGEEPILSCKNLWPDHIRFLNKICLNRSKSVTHNTQCRPSERACVVTHDVFVSG